jgi:hypothetical protein
MKMFILINEKGRVAATLRPRPNEIKDENTVTCAIVSRMNQSLREIEAPDEFIDIEDPSDLHERLEQLLSIVAPSADSR